MTLLTVTLVCGGTAFLVSSVLLFGVLRDLKEEKGEDNDED